MHNRINKEDYMVEKYTPIKLAEPTLEVIFQDVKNQDKSLATTHGQQKCPQLTFPFARCDVFQVPIKETCFLVPEDETNGKKVLEFTLDTSHIDIPAYEPGDTIAILPHNRKSDVQQLLNALQLSDNSEQFCRVKVLEGCTKKTAKVPAHIPPVTTPLELLRDCFNLHAVLKKQFLRALAECCSNNEERDFLNCLTSKEATIQYDDLIMKRGFTLSELLLLCPTCHPTLALLAEHLPRLLPRPYSIANSPCTKPNEIKFIFSVLNEQTGLTTGLLTHLATLMSDEAECYKPKLLCYLRNSNDFRYTKDETYSSDQILISIGTGVAPFLGFLEHKQHFSKEQQRGEELKQTWLFAGAVAPRALPHREQLLAYQEHGILNRFFESFSRVTDNCNARYVQDQLVAHASEFVELLMQPNTILYICADGADISKNIQGTIMNCMKKELHLPDEEVSLLIKDFRKSGKYREDIWI